VAQRTSSSRRSTNPSPSPSLLPREQLLAPDVEDEHSEQREGRAFRDDRIEDIGEYCLRDLRATAQLYRKLETTLLPLFKGG
jgi:hypothetical protein